MLRSLYSGISGLRAHQTMLDVTGNNIANVNTTAFKSSSAQFQDTLSQMIQGATGPQAEAGGSNPAQIGLGVRVAGISTNFAQGAQQATGKATDMMISGDGFFIVNSGTEQLYTRAGAFDFDASGRMVTADGSFVQGWSAVNGAISTGGVLGNITLPIDALAPATATTTAGMSGNLPSDLATGETVVRDITIYDDEGSSQTLTLSFTKTAAGWDVAGTDGVGGTGTSTLAFTDGALTTGGTMAIGGLTIDMSALTGFAKLSTATISTQNGNQAGTLQSYSIGSDGIVTGIFSNGASMSIAQLALATFSNPGGLEKAGSSTYRTSTNSGGAEVGTAGNGALGTLVSGALEMSNVDLSQEFTNLIVAQRGFQANARIITTSDEVLQELTNLKR